MTDRPATRAAGVTHATRGSPSTSTVQHPHWPCGAQPSFTDTSPSRSRSTDSSDSPGSTSTSTSLPLHDERDPIRHTHLRGGRIGACSPAARSSALAGGVILIAACGGNDDDSSGAQVDDDDNSDAQIEDRTTRNSATSRPQSCRRDLYVIRDAATLRLRAARQGRVRVGGPATLAVAPDPENQPTSSTPALHREGPPERRGDLRHRVHVRPRRHLERPAEREGEQLEFAFQVKAQADAPTDRRRAPTDVSPTPAAPLGVNRSAHANRSARLARRVARHAHWPGLPVVVLFATPARCTTQYCGPVLDSLLPLVGRLRRPA